MVISRPKEHWLLTPPVVNPIKSAIGTPSVMMMKGRWKMMAAVLNVFLIITVSSARVEMLHSNQHFPAMPATFGASANELTGILLPTAVLDAPYGCETLDPPRRLKGHPWIALVLRGGGCTFIQ